MRNNDPLVSVQGQFKNQSLRPSRLSTRSKWRTMTLSSQYKVQWPSRLNTRSVQFKIYDPLVSIQGQNEENDSLVSVQGQKSRTTTILSQYKVNSIQNLQPSCLSTRSWPISMHLFYWLLFSKPDEISVFILTYLLLR